MADPDARSSREDILDAAEALFARQGFGPTTIKQIGRAASQNPALLYYYFTGKDGLYSAVLQRLVGAMLTRGGAVLDAAGTPPDAIRALVAAQMEFVLTHPNAPRLLVRELIDHDARRAEAMLIEVAAGLFQRLCRLIEQGQREGQFRPDVEPRFAAVSTIAQVVYFIVARPAITLFFAAGAGGGRELPAGVIREFGRHAGDFAVAALSARAGGADRAL